MMRKKSTKDWRIPIEAILKYKATAGEQARCAAIRKAIMMHSARTILIERGYYMHPERYLWYFDVGFSGNLEGLYVTS